MATVITRATGIATAPRRTSSSVARTERAPDVFSAGDLSKVSSSKGNCSTPSTFEEAMLELQAAHAREVESLQRDLQKMSQKATRMAIRASQVGIPGDVDDAQHFGQQAAHVNGARVRSSCVAPAELASYQEAAPRQQSSDNVTEVSDHTFDDPFVVPERKWQDKNSIIVWNPFAEGQDKVSKFMNKFFKIDVESRKGRRAYKIVKSWPFEFMTYFMIIANSTFIGVRTQIEMDKVRSRTPMEQWPEVVELGFVAFFAFELVMKVLAEDVHVFFGSEWYWNLLDTILVFAAIAQLVIESVYGPESPNLTPARNIRLFRITRVLRFVRVVQACQTLRVMMYSIFKSLDSLIWVFLVLLYFMYVFAMILMHGAISYFDSHLDSGGGELSLQEQRYWQTPQDHIDDMTASWSSIDRAIMTLFEVVTGGRDWGKVFYTFLRVDAFYGMLFFAYVYFMVFLVLNVVIGTVVDVTTEVSSKDRDRMIDIELESLKGYAVDIKKFFNEADADGSGQLSWKEFKNHLENDRVKAYFQTLDLDIRKAHTLFGLLDCNNSGEVGIDEFLDGCLRLRGQAKSLDLNLVIYQLESLIGQVSRTSLRSTRSRSTA